MNRYSNREIYSVRVVEYIYIYLYVDGHKSDVIRTMEV